MSKYNHILIESKWQNYWKENNIYAVSNYSQKPKYYVLDMFPYPSGAGLHIGHPLGYTATDIVSRYKRLKGFHVLHPMGFDSFGLPAEQYAIDTGQHPADTTAQNIHNFKNQLYTLGFSYDWNREIHTSDPKFYRWTQWIFMQLFNAWYNKDTNKAEKLQTLINRFEKEGNKFVHAACDKKVKYFSKKEWMNFSEKEKQKILLSYRLVYLADSLVNWCPKLGTVLANDEIKNGYSERGGYPIERREMRQWMMRITAYVDRLDKNLKRLEWPNSLKEMQHNWIGKSEGCELYFEVAHKRIILSIFTTRPDTIFGVTYMAMAPEHKLVPTLTTPDQKEAVEKYISQIKNRSERERIADIHTVSGVFTGTYVINPINKKQIPLWISDYVLVDYGNGVIMGVPSSDDRDYRFAKHFDLPIIYVIKGTENLENPTQCKHGEMINSEFLNGMASRNAIEEVIRRAIYIKAGRKKINYRIRDAVFSRQRYWGEPFPIYYKDEIPYLIDKLDLPLILPPISNYKPTSVGKPPLARATDWKYKNKYRYEFTTMPVWAGSAWYFIRYTDPNNSIEFSSKKTTTYWNVVDLYIGGTEHATGHLLYSRFWNMFLYDMGFIGNEEPFKKLINQGMIQGRSSLIYRIKNKNKFVSYGLKENYTVSPIHVDIRFVKNDLLNIPAFKQWRPEYAKAEFILENGVYRCGYLIEKMSKNRYNTISPDEIIKKYGADTLRLYLMFLGPLKQKKPWNSEGIEGVYRFLKRFWNLFYNREGKWQVNSEKPSEKELKILHKTIKKVDSDTERLSFNTAISALMICVSELTSLKCHKSAILKDLLIILSCFSPHICEELWAKMGHVHSISKIKFPNWNEKYLQEDTYEYPISINGKVRTKKIIPVDFSKEEIKEKILTFNKIQKYTQGRKIKKVIIIPNKIVNIVI